MQYGRAAIAPLEARGERLEQAREHERQRLESIDRPFQFDRRLEAFLRHVRHERPHVVAARDGLPDESRRAEPRGKIGRRKRGELAQSSETPTFERRDRRDCLLKIFLRSSARSAKLSLLRVGPHLFTRAGAPRRCCSAPARFATAQGRHALARLRTPSASSVDSRPRGFFPKSRLAAARALRLLLPARPG